MVKKFEFKDNNLTLDISGAKFKIDTSDPELVARVLKFGEEAEEKANKIGKKEDFSKALEDMIEFCTTSIDTILGKGASKEIWGNRPITFFDALDVINYIMDSVKEDRSKKFNKYTPNRAKRRSK